MANYIGNQLSQGEFKKLDSIAAQFDGILTTFTLQFNGVDVQVGDANQLMVSVNGVIQEPLESYTLGNGGSEIVFTSAPPAGANCFITLFGGVGQVASTIADNTVTTEKIANGAITADKIADGTVIAADLADASVTEQKIADSSVTTNKLADASVTVEKIDTNTIATKGSSIALSIALG